MGLGWSQGRVEIVQIATELSIWHLGLDGIVLAVDKVKSALRKRRVDGSAGVVLKDPKSGAVAVGSKVDRLRVDGRARATVKIDDGEPAGCTRFRTRTEEVVEVVFGSVRGDWGGLGNNNGLGEEVIVLVNWRIERDAVVHDDHAGEPVGNVDISATWLWQAAKHLIADGCEIRLSAEVLASKGVGLIGNEEAEGEVLVNGTAVATKVLEVKQSCGGVAGGPQE